YIQSSTPPHLPIHTADLPSRSYRTVAKCCRSGMTPGECSSQCVLARVDVTKPAGPFAEQLAILDSLDESGRVQVLLLELLGRQSCGIDRGKQYPSGEVNALAGVEPRTHFMAENTRWNPLR